jgi:hypothetical protein
MLVGGVSWRQFDAPRCVALPCLFLSRCEPRTLFHLAVHVLTHSLSLPRVSQRERMERALHRLAAAAAAAVPAARVAVAAAAATAAVTAATHAATASFSHLAAARTAAAA